MGIYSRCTVQCPTVYTTSSVSPAVVSPRRDTKRYMSGMSTLLSPFCRRNEPGSSPFEMQNQSVFNFKDSPACYSGEPRKSPGCRSFGEHR